jgi:hypothetical protein
MRTIYSQGDLLQKLIEDLLSFRYVLQPVYCLFVLVLTTNQQQNPNRTYIMLEEKSFRTRDISTQVNATFHNMAADRKINLAVKFEGPHDAATIEAGVIQCFHR